MLEWFLSFFRKRVEKKKEVEPVKVEAPKPADELAKDDEYIVKVLTGKEPRENEIFPDISRYRKMDYNKFLGGHLVTKATEGNSIVDKTFKFNADECKARGIAFYVYHFYRWEIDPIEQAKHFLKTIDGYNVYTPLIVDYEGSTRQDHEDLENDLGDLKTFIKYVNEKTNSKMIIYTGEYLLNKLSFDQEFAEICGNPWIANYSRKPTKFGPWGSYWAWQFSSSYKLEGIVSPKGGDANYFYNK